ncbi:8-oxo-dGTP diphosphatase [Chitinispirillales bacterium ANBcel5]|uniref:8-oxo-dGTP diphosphatase n=1 Tax=Cellulosispirillum alkaliphilum TaxID=3039283 RepID=UPI002A54C482|nr:8-oxo-dGTP diphosphatase [Chitinispirillales bacterium ANBcel5]
MKNQNTPKVSSHPVSHCSVCDIDWPNWSFTEKAVLCFVMSGDEVMLIHKKTGLGKGKINAPGGRIEKNERAIDAAVRETIEETGVTPLNLEHMADLQFIFTDGYSLMGTVFVATAFSGNAKNTFEADPFWCKLKSIPYEKMWADDIHWLPLVLEGKKVTGQFIFKEDTMLSHQVFTGLSDTVL